MVLLRSIVAPVLWITILHIIALYIFSQGFLLSRVVIEKHSECYGNGTHDGDDAEVPWMKQQLGHSCTEVPPIYKKAVILVIDALRSDFVRYDEAAAAAAAVNGTNVPPYINKLGSIHRKLRDSPEHALLFDFIADAPTTTMQRIQGLTTGSLPTFVDAGSNFGAAAITEDNILLQLKQAGKRLVFMGDDTWLELFPDIFTTSHAFPSFDVTDLHTVDAGIEQNLFPALESSEDWDVLVAHFLGVDHIGHTHGPDHPTMAEKLDQLDGIIDRVMRELGDDTVLLIFGDHGMTRSGDHGGATPREVTSALFAYSTTSPVGPPKGLRSMNGMWDESSKEVFQIDLVPTIAVLLGAAIPFGNLGCVISDLVLRPPPRGVNNIQSNADELSPLGALLSFERANVALRANGRQAQKFLAAYAEVSTELPAARLTVINERFERADKMLANIVDNGSDDSIIEAVAMHRHVNFIYRSALLELREMCQDVWARFDVVSMAAGAVLFILTIVAQIVYIARPTGCHNSWRFVFVTLFSTSLLFFFICIAIRIDHSSARMYSAGMGAMMSLCAFLWPIRSISSTLRQVNSVSIAGWISIIVVGLSGFSNSFLITEDRVVGFIFTSLLVLQACILAQKNNWAGFCVAILGICTMRATIHLGVCREENENCGAALISTISLGTAPAIVASAIIAGGLFWLLRNNRRLIVPTVICRFLSPVGFFLVTTFWISQLAFDGSDHNVDLLKSHEWELVILVPRLIFAIVVIGIIVLITKPVFMSVVFPGDRNKNKSIQGTFLQLRNEYQQNSSRMDNVPSIYGGFNVVSAAILGLILILLPLPFLLLGSRHSLGLLPAFIIAFVILQLSRSHHLQFFFPNLWKQLRPRRIKKGHYNLRTRPAENCTKRSSHPQNFNHGTELPWLCVASWALAAISFFYATGHQPTFSAIHWASGMTGMEHMNVVVSGVLVTVNTFASYILFSLGLPLLLLWHYSESSETGELGLCVESGSLGAAMGRLFVAYSLMTGIRTISSLGAATLLRRHLMVWKIFAPKFVFEAAVLFVTDIACVLSGLFLIRILSVISGTIRRIETHQRH